MKPASPVALFSSRALGRWMPGAEARAVLWHHLRAALAVGSVVSLLHLGGMLAWLDVLMLNLVGGAGPIVTASPAPSRELPVVLLIGAPLYETEFDQASPLDPAKLARLLATIPVAPDKKPAAVVLDLDVSPGPAQAGREPLDGALKRLVQAGITVVVPLPLRVSTPDLQRIKFDWLKQGCGWNSPAAAGRFVIGLTDVVTHHGAAVQFDPHLPTLGVLAARPAQRDRLCQLVGVPDNRWQGPLLSSSFDSRALGVSVQASALVPFNARFFTAGEEHILVVDHLDTLPRSANGVAPDLRARTVFIGSSFNPQDRFATPLEGAGRTVEGVVLHAATAYSVQHPVGVVGGLLALGVDIVLGVAMGYCFVWTWGWHVRARRRATAHAGWALQLAPRLTLAINFVIAGVLVIVFMLLASAFFFPANLWINPGPIILGVFAKFVLASRNEAADHDHAAGHQGASSAVRWIDTTMLTLLVAAAIAGLILSH